MLGVLQRRGQQLGDRRLALGARVPTGDRVVAVPAHDDLQRVAGGQLVDAPVGGIAGVAHRLAEFLASLDLASAVVEGVGEEARHVGRAGHGRFLPIFSLASGYHRSARTATLRRHLVAVPARIAHRGRDRIVLHLPEHWPWYDPWDGVIRGHPPHPPGTASPRRLTQPGHQPDPRTTPAVHRHDTTPNRPGHTEEPSAADSARPTTRETINSPKETII